MVNRRSASRLSRRSRTVSAVIGIAAVFWMVWVFGVQEPRMEIRPPAPQAQRSENLKFSTLDADGEIVVTLIRYQESPMELRFRTMPTGVRLIVSELSWENRSTTKLERVLYSRDLTKGEANGVDAMLEFLRRPRRDAFVMHPVELRIEHLRAGRVIGREAFVEPRLIHEWNGAPRATLDQDPELVRMLEDQAREVGLTLEDLKRWVTFEQLLEVEPN